MPMILTQKAKKLTLWSLISLVLFVFVLFIFGVFRPIETASPELLELEQIYLDQHYSEYMSAYQSLDKPENTYYFEAEDFILEAGQSVDQGVYHWIDETSIFLEVDIEEAGLYTIKINYMAKIADYLPITLALKLNGDIESPYYEASQMTLDTLWIETSSEIGKDRYGNDVNVEQAPYEIYQESILKDARGLYKEGLTVFLEEDTHIIELEKIHGDLFVQSISLQSVESYPSYDTYLASHIIENKHQMIVLEAEESYYRNSSTISRGVSRDPLVEPFSMTKLRLNVLGIDSYQESGDAVTWQPEIIEAGLYYITLKASQLRQNTTVYRTLYVNGKIPFEEAKHIPISYQRDWQNVTLSSVSKEPFLIYLEPGDIITLEVDSSLFRSIYEEMRKLSSEMTALGLDVTKLTRNNTDRGIDWDMIQYFPELENQLNDWILRLEVMNETLKKLYGFERDAQIIRDLRAAISRLETILKDIDELPRRLTLLSQGSSSAVQLISNQLDQVLRQPLILDKIYIHQNLEDLPNPNPTLFQSAWISMARFFLSFVDPSYTERADDNELEVWVNRSRQYVDLMQKLTDDRFTSQTNIRVKVSLINDDSKLLLANSANQQPDVALGVSAWIPNEYGMRGMLHDLSGEENFSQVISVYNPEQLVPMVYNNKLFGLPETENFYVLFYRKDILNELNLSVPETWDDVLGMLPVLRRFGMSFYIPLSSSSAQKSFDATGPFIYQFEGKIFADDGLSGAIDDENTIRALTFMTDLYREYSMPDQVPSFFNSFRYTTIPIGIGDFGMYLQLMNAASDISGLWDIALVPGVEHTVYNPQTMMNETYINRSMPGAQQAGIIFEKSDKKDEAWAFLSWWMSKDTQILFAETLVNTLGTRYLWNTANLEAFESMRWNQTHKDIILEQWTHLREVPKIPGSYIVEREISNTWNQVIYNDQNLRSTVSDAMLKIDKELSRKMIEFGYINAQGQVIKPFIIPTRDEILRWYDA
ncbi:MAG: hypothetical protein CVV61_06480 [Tenericutes bacterium HGW-Tenericutes-6]|nr:MAG: hypothetical protein CVV61_06480 [Tenericutes bacterium HGW-Tenericutes-6]